MTVDLGAGAYLGIETLIGSQGTDTLGRPRTRPMFGMSLASDSGDVGGLAFSGIENLTGGTEADDFLLSAAAAVSGIIDGSGGDNRIEITGTSADDIVMIGVPAVTVNSNSTTYTNIGRLDLITLEGLDQITVNPAAQDSRRR